jgi:FAD/FMN-containing dehydrogenase
VLDRLKALVGPGGFVEGPEDTAAHSRPWRGKWEGRTPLVLRPKTTGEIAAIVKLCAETRTPIVPQGGNTGMTYGGLP